MMKEYIILFGSFALLCYGLPVTKEKKVPEVPATPELETALEYERYLKEVVDALENDPEFRKKLDKAPEEDIRTGKIAQELDYVNHNVRTKLDEIKRRELDRLRALATKEFELENEINHENLKMHQHLDYKNKNRFEIEDLKKLIKKTAEDLAEIDKKRQAEFKEYEMQKEFEKEMKREELNEEQRKQFDEEQNRLKKEHKNHEKIHYPGNKAQLEEVWEKQDHMDKNDFDPRKLFMFHDVDGNGFWDETEVKALFITELDKLYKSGLPDRDVKERAEEMELMREDFFRTTDLNRDSIITFEEFMKRTNQVQYNSDPEWKTIHEKPRFTHEEYLEFEHKRKEEVDRMIAQGLIPPHPNMPQGNYQQHPQMHYQNPQQQHIQQQQQYQQQQQQYQQQQYQPQQHPPQQVQLNPNQIYQQIPVNQQQPVINNLSPQQQQHVYVHNVPSNQPVESNASAYQPPKANNIPHQQQPVATNKIDQQNQPTNNIQQQGNNIPQKH